MMKVMGEPLTITVGYQATERVILEVLGRERPDDDYWDGNWLVVDVHIRAGGFIGHCVANLRTDELQRFRNELAEVYEAVEGEAVLASLENWLALTVQCDRRGQVTVEGEATDRPGIGNRLKFSLPTMDQTFLPPLIEQLAACERDYPVVGGRPAG